MVGGLTTNLKNSFLADGLTYTIAKKTVAVLIWSVLAFIAAANFTWYFIPPEDFYPYLMDIENHPVLLGTLVTITIFLNILKCIVLSCLC